MHAAMVEAADASVAWVKLHVMMVEAEVASSEASVKLHVAILWWKLRVHRRRE